MQWTSPSRSNKNKERAPPDEPIPSPLPLVRFQALFLSIKTVIGQILPLLNLPCQTFLGKLIPLPRHHPPPPRKFGGERRKNSITTNGTTTYSFNVMENGDLVRKELSILIAGEEESGEEAEPMTPSGEEEAEISLNSVLGITNPKTMKLVGKIVGKEIVVMIGPGATHSFISNTTVEKLNQPVFPSRNVGVALGTGETVHGECKGLLLQLQDHEI